MRVSEYSVRIQQFRDMDVPKSPFRVRMVRNKQLRPSAMTLQKYLENPYNKPDTIEHFMQFALSIYKKCPFGTQIIINNNKL